MFIYLTLSIMFRINIKTNSSSVISMTTNDYYIYSILFLKLVNIDRESTSIFCNDSHTNYERNHLHFLFRIDKQNITST